MSNCLLRAAIQINGNHIIEMLGGNKQTDLVIYDDLNVNCHVYAVFSTSNFCFFFFSLSSYIIRTKKSLKPKKSDARAQYTFLKLILKEQSFDVVWALGQPCKAEM